MRSLRFPKLLKWFCLLAFALNAAFVQGGMVLCADLNGQSRLEWGCDRDSEGHCVASCDAAFSSTPHDSSFPGTCDDEPASSLIGKTLPTKSVAFEALKSALTFVALPQILAFEIPLIPNKRLVLGTPRPPNSVAQIRTIVLLV